MAHRGLRSYRDESAGFDIVISPRHRHAGRDGGVAPALAARPRLPVRLRGGRRDPDHRGRCAAAHRHVRVRGDGRRDRVRRRVYAADARPLGNDVLHRARDRDPVRVGVPRRYDGHPVRRLRVHRNPRSVRARPRPALHLRRVDPHRVPRDGDDDGRIGSIDLVARAGRWPRGNRVGSPRRPRRGPVPVLEVALARRPVWRPDFELRGLVRCRHGPLPRRWTWSRDTRAPARMSRSVLLILPGVLLTSGLQFGILATAYGFFVSTLLGLGIVLLVVGLAWRSLAIMPRALFAPNPWSTATVVARRRRIAREDGRT